MSKRPSDKTTLNDFFREEAKDLLGLSETLENGLRSAPALPQNIELPLPELPAIAAAPESEQRAYWRSLRSFFRSGRGGGLPTGKQAFPALMHAYRGQALIQRDFPCWIAEGTSELSPFQSFHPINQLLETAVEQVAANAGQTGILKDNLLRLEAIIREKVSFADGIYKADPVFREALEALKTKLNIQGEEAKSFSEELRQLHRHLPSDGVLLPATPQAPLYLLGLIMHRRLAFQRNAWKAEVAQLINQLKELLAVEQQKNPESHSPEHLQDTMEFADSFLNFDELSSVLPDQSMDAMPAERRKRIEKLVSTLERADDLLFQLEVSVVDAGRSSDMPQIDWVQNFSGFEYSRADAGNICRTASAIYDRLMKDAATFFAAFRIGRLEVNNQYQPEVHGELFAHFDWRSFSERERSACPFVLLLNGTTELLEEELTDFSRLLSSHRPIKIMAWKNRKPTATEKPETDAIFRQELGAIAVAHRNTFVFQSAGIHNQHLYEGFSRGVAAVAPAVFHLLAPSKDIDKSPAALWSSAAVEGRAFPGFVFDSLAGPKWGNRFDLQNNPQVEADWPQHTLKLRTAKEQDTAWTLPFTYADFAAQDARYVHYYSLVPPQYWNEDLVPLANYLRYSDEEGLAQVPYIWLVDDQHQLQRAAVAWPMVLACQERLDFWHYLQENAGIHSYHVEQATEQLQKEIETKAEERIAALQAEHEEEIDRVREKTARQAMERLADVLLDLDTELPLLKDERTAPIATTEAIPKEEASGTHQEPISTAEPEPSKPEEEEPMLAEAWIDTPLCTSCNECIDTNKNIFQYDANKQAYVADPKGGSFADIVKAAEKCPVAIIHPGAPQNPDEPELDKWLARAAPFQA